MGWAAVVTHAAVSPPTFERYQVILERQPFGPALSAESTEASTTSTTMVATSATGEALGLRACGLVQVEGEGLRAGLVDSKTGKSYFLAPGEMEDGIRVASVNFETEEVVVQRGSEMAILRLKEAGPGEKKAGGSAVTRPAFTPPRPPTMSAPTPPSTPSSSPPPPPPRLQGPELEKQLREYQMEVIRKGLPPLPIPLTPEQDAQLVQEGILPPQTPMVIQRPDAQIIIQPAPAGVTVGGAVITQ